MSIRANILEGFERTPFLRFTSSLTARQLDGDESEVLFGATCDGLPAGLLIIAPDRRQESGSIKSLFVDTPLRGRGVGRLLLEKAQEFASQSHWEKLGASWFDDALFAADIEAFFKAMDFSAPKTNSTLFRASQALLEIACETRIRESAPGIAMFAWADRTAADEVAMKELKEEHEIIDGLHMDGETLLQISEETSLGLRQDGRLAGWMLHHRITTDCVRYSSLWVKPSLIGRGFGVSLAIASARRQHAVANEIPRFTFLVSNKNDAMHRFMSRRFRGAVDSTSKMLQSKKILNHQRAAR